MKVDCYKVDLLEQRQEVITFLTLANILDIIAIRDKNFVLIIDKETIKKAITDIANTEINSVYFDVIPFGLNYYKAYLSLPNEEFIKCYKICKSGQEEDFNSALLEIYNLESVIAITDYDGKYICDKSVISDMLCLGRNKIVSIYTSTKIDFLEYSRVLLNTDMHIEYVNTDEWTKNIEDEPVEESIPNEEPIEDSIPTAIDTFPSTDELLEQRGIEYKVSFKSNSSALGSIVKSLLDNYRHIDDYVLGEFIYMQIKLIRHCGNPNHKDTIEDLKGYSELISRNANTLNKDTK